MEVKLTMFSPSHNASQSYFLHFQFPVNHFFLTIGEEVNQEKELLYMIRVHPLSCSVCASVLVLSKNGDGNDSCPFGQALRNCQTHHILSWEHLTVCICWWDNGTASKAEDKTGPHQDLQSWLWPNWWHNYSLVDIPGILNCVVRCPRALQQIYTGSVGYFKLPRESLWHLLDTMWTTSLR